MKRVLFSVLILAAPLAFGQTATPPPSGQELLETVNSFKAKLDDLTDAREALKKQVADLQAQINQLTAQVAKQPSGNYATQDDLKALQAAITAVDKKRQADNDATVQTLKDLAKISGTKPPTTPVAPHPTPHLNPTSSVVAPLPAADGPGFTYVAVPNDTLVKISKKLFKEQHIKVSADEILKANPSLKGDAKNLKEGDKLFIPAPNGTDSADATK